MSKISELKVWIKYLCLRRRWSQKSCRLRAVLSSNSFINIKCYLKAYKFRMTTVRIHKICELVIMHETLSMITSRDSCIIKCILK